MDNPIILLGAARSGTTLLGHLLEQHPSVAYWEEPNHIWKYRHAYRRHDVFTARDATPKVSAYIRGQFSRYVQKRGKERFVEKTPHNCFRVPFVRKIFPEAKIVHMIRDGRAVAVSAMGQWKRGLVVREREEKSREIYNSSYDEKQQTQNIFENLKDSIYTIRKFLLDTQRIQVGIWPLIELPAYIPGVMRTFGRKVFGDRGFLWGPCFPGMRAMSQTFSLIETCALQWCLSVQAVMSNVKDMESDKYLEVRYEDLLENADRFIKDICYFAELKRSKELINAAKEMIRNTEKDRWRRWISERDAAVLESWLGPLLRQLGYMV